MLPADWEKVQLVFANAAELHGSDRACYLDEACVGSAELRAEVESLLASDTSDTQIISGAIEDVAMNLLGHESPVGRRVGAYRIIRELGRGGMGSVYLAVRDDDQYQKQVAIKLVRRDFNSASVLGRFRSEMQILATLDHPYVARLLDGGTTTDNLPYLVMEYVDGMPIDVYCQKNGLNAERICELFCKVCEAVSYAHRNLVIHRDLKPGNILVTVDGNPKLLDFGIAKLLAPTPGSGFVTQTAMQPLTPDYASPEQVRGDPVTTATDVYQLGTLLYELLTGQKPHRMQTYTAAEIARVVCREDVTRPSVAAGEANTAVPRKRLEGDLDNIVLMALRKEPERRYPSAEQFREDVLRHLKSMPVVAREDTVLYRSSRFLRRNRLAVAAAALLFLTLAGGIIATDRQRRQSDMHRRQAEQERKRAEKRMQQLLQLANKSLFEVHGAIATLPGATEARRKIVSATLEFLDSLSQDDNLDFELARMIADGYFIMAQVQGLPFRPNLGQPKEALANLVKANAVMDKLKRREPNNPRVWLIAVGLDQVAGVILENQGRNGDAMAHYDKALAAARKMASIVPNDPEAQTQEAIMNHQFALSYAESDPARALPYARRETELYERLAAKSTGEELPNALGSSYLMLGRLAANMGHSDEAMEHLKKAVELREGLNRKYPDNSVLMRNLLVTYSRVGDLLGAPFQETTLRQPRQALAYYRKTEAIAERLNKHDPNDRLAQMDLATALMRIGAVLEQPRERAESLAALRRSAKLFEGLPQGVKGVRERSSLALTYEYLARRLESAQPKEALDYYRRSLQVAEQALATVPEQGLRVQILNDWRGIATVLASLGDRPGALAAAEKSITIARQFAESAPNHEGLRRQVPKAQFTRGLVYQALARRPDTGQQQRVGDWAAAKDAFERSRAQWKDLADAANQASAAARIEECEQGLRR